MNYIGKRVHIWRLAVPWHRFYAPFKSNSPAFGWVINIVIFSHAVQIYGKKNSNEYIRQIKYLTKGASK